MTENVTQDDLRQRMIDLAPDVVGTTAITPAIYVAEEVLKLAAEVVPGALRVLGGIHATFMYRQSCPKHLGSTSSSAARARKS